MRPKTIIRRRALLTGGVGAIVATAVTGLKDPSTAQAADGYVQLGEENHATGVTAIVNDADTDGGDTLRVTAHNGVPLTVGQDVAASHDSAIYVSTAGDGPAVDAVSKGTAIVAYSSGRYGVFAESDAPSGIGVYGYGLVSGGRGVYGYGSSAGVMGTSLHENGYGVRGEARRGVGAGVYGEATGDAAGVLGRSKLGFAIRGDGRIKFDKVSGQAKIAAGQTAVTITPGVNIHRGSFMLLTPKADIGSRGLWFTTNPTSDTVTIHISSPRTVATTIAWLLLG